MAALNRYGDRSGKLSGPIFNKKHGAEPVDSRCREKLHPLSSPSVLHFLQQGLNLSRTESPTRGQVFKLASGDTERSRV